MSTGCGSFAARAFSALIVLIFTAAYAQAQSPAIPMATLPSRLPDVQDELQLTVAERPVGQDTYWLDNGGYGEPWTWQMVPEGLLYRSYLAGPREARFGGVWAYEPDHGWYWDSTLGARAGLIRYGNTDPAWPEGWQLDFEGGALLRQDWELELDTVAVDFRIGVPLTYREGPVQYKFAYYHISSHLTDDFLRNNPGSKPLNILRDALVAGMGYYATRDLRFYGEVGWAFNTDDGAEPWEVQFGIDYAPETCTGTCGAPFAAINTHLRETADWGGHINMQAGWMWRRHPGGPLLRVGFQYFNGKSPQLQFFDEHEEQYGFGIWYDF